ncbi:MAG: winged helix-turn-helix domain-containing protein, partial [Gammaproteobacteria bacterium]|nr:winged helix-turn-helix domain-containing protein [Gammaproteobacteria bacterium]
GTEFRMLAKLVRAPGHAVSYDMLMNATMQSLVTNNTINTHMRNIRKKFEEIDPEFDCIKSEYGFGYRWSAK